MNAVLLFVVVVILPSGQPQVNATAVLACPSQQKVMDTYQQAQTDGHILDWRAHCLDTGMRLPTGT